MLIEDILHLWQTRIIYLQVPGIALSIDVYMEDVMQLGRYSHYYRITTTFVGWAFLTTSAFHFRESSAAI